MDEKLYLTEDQREDYQRHLAIEEAAMSNPYDDATGITGATLEDGLTGPGADKALQNYRTKFHGGVGAAPTSAQGSIGWSPDFKSEPPKRLTLSGPEVEEAWQQAVNQVFPELASSTPTNDSHRAMRIQGQATLNSLQAIIEDARYSRLREKEYDRAMDLLFQVSQILTELTK